ncbi:MAG: dTMP kinase [Anaerolineae bacterium]
MPTGAPEQPKRKHPGLFVTFEGPEGSGKTTQMGLLAPWLQAQGLDVLTLREPGGTRIGDQVRNIVLNPAHTEMLPATEILLFSAARAQVVGERVLPHLQKGGVVLCDRYADSTMAYQGYGLGLDLEALRSITRFATGGLVPDLTILLDVPVEVGLRRKAGGCGEEWNRMEQKARSYHKRVRAGYHRMASLEPHRWFVADATLPIEEVQAAIRERVMREIAA